MKMEIVKKTSKHNTSALKNRKIKYIVIHYTAGTHSKTGKAKDTAKYFSTLVREASADFIVDDNTAVQYNPDIENRYSWHCGGSKVTGSKGGSLNGKCTNKNSIGIEICSSSKNGKVYPANNENWYFSEAAINKAVELTQYLMKKYNIPASQVVRHYDVTGKYCPGIVGWNADSGSEVKWKEFKSKISQKTDENNNQASNSVKAPFKVKVSISDLNIRKGPGTNYEKTGKYSGKGTFTIVDVKTGKGSKTGWGKLKSGAGWISLDYVKRV